MSARPPRLFEPNGRWPGERADERRAAGSSRLESSAERRRQAHFAFRSEPLRRQAFRTWNQRDLLRKRPRAVFLPNGFARRLFSTRSCHLDHGLRRPARPAGIDRCLPQTLIEREPKMAANGDAHSRQRWLGFVVVQPIPSCRPHETVPRIEDYFSQRRSAFESSGSGAEGGSALSSRAAPERGTVMSRREAKGTMPNATCRGASRRRL